MKVNTLPAIFLVFVFLCGAGALGFFYLYLPQNTFEALPLPTLLPTPRKETSGMGEPTQKEITIYFLTEDCSRLEGEKRTVLSPESIPERVHKALDEMLRGPVSTKLLKPVPANTQIQSVFWDDVTGRISVSFSDELVQGNPGHALSEWVTIYSIVDTAAEQSPAVKEVQLLVNGEPVNNAFTIWDWSLPFLPDKSAIRSPTPGNP